MFFWYESVGTYFFKKFMMYGFDFDEGLHFLEGGHHRKGFFFFDVLFLTADGTIADIRSHLLFVYIITSQQTNGKSRATVTANYHNIFLFLSTILSPAAKLH
jgi:hypothetical protein